MLSFHLHCVLSVVGCHCTSCQEIMELSHLILWFMWFPFTTRQTSFTVLLTLHLTGNSLQKKVHCTVLLKESFPNFQADAYFVLVSCIVSAVFIYSCELESLRMLYKSVACKALNLFLGLPSHLFHFYLSICPVFLTAVTVFRKPNTIPLCFSIALVLNFFLSWLLLLLPSTFFLDVLFSFSPVVCNP